MEENKREYSVIGTVTIGTDEYRDLLEEKYEAEKEKSQWHDKWYKEYSQRLEVEKECNKLKEELDKCKKLMGKIKDKEGNVDAENFIDLITAIIMGD